MIEVVQLNDDKILFERSPRNPERICSHRNPGGTDPGTEDGAVRCRLMMRVMGFMLDRLCIDEAVQKQGADDDEEGDGFTTESEHKTTRVNGEMLEEAPYRCQDGNGVGASL